MHNAVAGLLANNFSAERVLQDLAAIMQLARDAKLRKHPLGFLHGELFGNDQLALRLHIWDSAAREAQQPGWLIHTHTFSLTSVVLAGSLTNHSYTWTEGVLPPKSRLYQIGYDGISSQLRATGKFGTVQQVSAEDIAAVGFYSVSRGSFHTTVVAEGIFTATVALAVKGSGAPMVVGSIDGAPSYSYERREVTQDERERILDKLEKQLTLVAGS